MTQEYQAFLDDVTTAAHVLAGAGVPDPTLPLGRRLTGTSTFSAPSGSAPGLVVLLPTGAARVDWYIAEVLAGSRLIRPLLKWDNEQWQPPGGAHRVGARAVVPLLPRDVNATEVTAFVAFATAFTANSEQVATIRKRAVTANSVFKPCLDIYDAWVTSHPDESRLSRLTEHLLGASEETRGVIQARSSTRHAGADEEQIIRSVVNSLRRSAGTNYQGLVALAIAEELLSTRSAWYIHYPPPREYMRDMALRFTGTAGYNVDIDPDIDILVKNAAWHPATGHDEPVVMLSVKTSLADRAGAAARWKMYFDVATRSCPFEGQLEGCAWHDQGLRFAKPDVKIRLQHCIVTANIYKVGSDERYAEEGELGSSQTKANTFMFDKRYATRVGDNVEMEGWEPLTALQNLLDSLADKQALPH